MLKVFLHGVVVFFLMATATPSWATVFNWNNTSGGEFTESTNWTPIGVPDTLDTAIFNVSAFYTVDFDASLAGPEQSSNNFEVTSPTTITFDMFNEGAEAAFDYHLTSSTAAAHIGGPTSSLFPAKLVIQGGVGSFLFPPFSGRSRVYTDGFLQVGRDANSKGVLELDGADWTSTNTTFIGLNGTGSLTIKNDATMSNVTGLVGFGFGSNATVTIDGGQWDNSADLQVATSGTATVTVNPNPSIIGSELTSDNAFIAVNGASTGTVNLNGGSWSNSGSLYVGGGAVSQGGAGNLNVNTSGNLSVGGDLKVYPTATFVLNDGTVDVTGEFDWLQATTLTIDNSDRFTAGLLTFTPGAGLTYAADTTDPSAHLTVGQISADPGSMTWTSGPLNITNGDLAIDDTAPLGGVVTLNANRPLTVSGALRVGTAGTTGALFIINGVQVDSGSGRIGNTNPASSTIPVAIDQPGTTWAMTGDLTMGNVAGSGAQLLITNEATVTNVDAFVSPDPALHSELLIQSTTGTSTWDNSGSVYLGGNASTVGGTVTMDVNTGGAVNAGTQMRIWDNATVTFNGGSLTTPQLHVSGIFNHAGSLDFTGSGPIGDLILDGGTVNAPSIDFGTKNLTGSGVLNGKVTVGGDVTATGDLTIGDATLLDGVVIGGNLNVGAHHLIINKKGFLPLGSSTVISGGMLTASDGVAIPVGAGLSVSGSIAARLVQQSGSVIEATSGDLTLGDAGSVAGFFSDGELMVGAGRTVTLMDANEAVVGSLTSLGSSGGSPGHLVAVNGILVESGKNVVGYGTINTLNDPAFPVINNGSILGNSLAEPITLTGYVKGVGTCDKCNITGTDAPGFSPASVNRGSVFYRGTMEIEIGGVLPGSDFDQLNHILGAGIADLGGVLDVRLVNGFAPVLGNRFQFLTASSVQGQFDATLLPSLTPGLGWALDYAPDGVALVVSIPGDFDGDYDVDGFDMLAWQRGESPNPLNAADLADWEASFGAAPLAAPSRVPEPTTLALLLLAAALGTASGCR